MSFDAFPSDAALPELRIASDPGLMREFFRRYLRPVARETLYIQECRLSRVRYRPANRCILQYTLRLVESETGRERSQWVTGLIYADERCSRIWRKLRAADPGQKIPDAFPTFEPVSFIPDLRMLVQVFPYDYQLPNLPLLMAGPPPDLERLLLNRIGPGDWHAEAWTVEPIRYWAKLRAVVRYTLRARDAVTGRREERRFYVKHCRGEEGDRTYQILRALAERSDAGGGGFTVGRPIAYLGGLHALVQEESPGVSLRRVLCQSRDAAAALRKVARALAAFHLDPAAITRHYRHQDAISALKKAEQHLQWACPHLRSEVEAIVGAVAAGLEEGPLKPTHGNLKLSHIVLDGDDLAVFDLDTVALADPILDPAYILAQLTELPLRTPLSRDWVRTTARAFVEEYFAHVPKVWRSRLPLHFAGATLRVSVGFIRHPVPGWPEKIAALVEEAKVSLTRSIW